MKDATAARPIAAAPSQNQLQHQLPPPAPRRGSLKKSASAATLLGGGAVAASRYLLQEELGRGASGQVRRAGVELKKRNRNKVGRTLAAEKKSGETPAIY
jgi:hypothetical protein